MVLSQLQWTMSCPQATPPLHARPRAPLGSPHPPHKPGTCTSKPGDIASQPKKKTKIQQQTNKQEEPSSHQRKQGPQAPREPEHEAWGEAWDDLRASASAEALHTTVERHPGERPSMERHPMELASASGLAARGPTCRCGRGKPQNHVFSFRASRGRKLRLKESS